MWVVLRILVFTLWYGRGFFFSRAGAHAFSKLSGLQVCLATFRQTKYSIFRNGKSGAKINPGYCSLLDEFCGLKYFHLFLIYCEHHNAGNKDEQPTNNVEQWSERSHGCIATSHLSLRCRWLEAPRRHFLGREGKILEIFIYAIQYLNLKEGEKIGIVIG